MIRQFGGDKPAWVLDTKETTYILRTLPSGQIEHVYYGRHLTIEEESDITPLLERHLFPAGNTCVYSGEFSQTALEELALECSGEGKGDVRAPMITLTACDGSRTTDFVFESASVTEGKATLSELPSSYDETGQVQCLSVNLRDQNHNYSLTLNYWVFPDCDVVSRNAVFRNDSAEPVFLERLMSWQIDLRRDSCCVTSFHGSWAAEMGRQRTALSRGSLLLESTAGASSSRTNPFFMVSDENTTEDNGEVFGFHLFYSGNHCERIAPSSFGKTRLQAGIHPQGFSMTLAPGASFEAPEGAMSFSDKGFNGLSVHLHTFIREHVVRGAWKKKERPVLLNSWEAVYMNISESGLLRLARAAAEAGIELFVMDDGWFGKRNDDTKGLGDWDPNPQKLPGGLAGIAKKVNALGMDFGIWVEPEMVNTDSDLYRTHPDWVMDIPGMAHSEGRHQRILDLANPEVVDWLIEKMTEVFSSAPISYVKWDMNRIASDVYSRALPPGRQQEASYRYMTGLYRLLGTLTERFPQILFEGCASGGNRFDCGMLCYFPQIWASDNTDAVSRLDIQNGYSYGYPQSTCSAHVSDCPNHQTLRTTPLSSRFSVASFGLLGYELNLSDLGQKDREQIKMQVLMYKRWRKTLQFGQLYRGRGGSFSGGHLYEWTIVSADRDEAVGLLMQKEARPGEAQTVFRARGLDPGVRYHFFSVPEPVDPMAFGSLINTQLPIHVRQGSLVHRAVARVARMEGEKEDVTAFGDVLMAGVCLAPAFAGTGMSDEVRLFSDWASRMYFMTRRDAPQEDA